MSEQQSANSGDPPHRQLQLAHEKYFQRLAEVSAQCQSQFQTIQTEYERALEKAFQSQQPEHFQTAQDAYQRDWQAACNNASQAQQYADAYREYKAAIKNFIASTNMDDLNFTDIAHLSQSLFTVSRTAMCSTPVNPTPINNPFEQQK
jgi:selenocysteine lyase/cysteine desulfurase